MKRPDDYHDESNWRDLVEKDRVIVEDAWVLYHVRYDSVMGGESC